MNEKIKIKYSVRESALVAVVAIAILVASAVFDIHIGSTRTFAKMLFITAVVNFFNAIRLCFTRIEVDESGILYKAFTKKAFINWSETDRIYINSDGSNPNAPIIIQIGDSKITVSNKCKNYSELRSFLIERNMLKYLGGVAVEQ
ncbi:hypothetical protein [Butyrivibrio sp. AE2005]|uniref:hypothetical protein n=1 Tax=Butyrivibrio sp. AE2005 TaxID=1496722 RepID=UPI00047C0D1A|nr:hypothetical protein [Butyrivibrio sp. AE2005]